jgi:hypothetical protein
MDINIDFYREMQWLFDERLQETKPERRKGRGKVAHYQIAHATNKEKSTHQLTIGKVYSDPIEVPPSEIVVRKVIACIFLLRPEIISPLTWDKPKVVPAGKKWACIVRIHWNERYDYSLEPAEQKELL